MSGVGITYLWPSKKFPPFIRLEGKRGDYEVYTPERTCRNEDGWCSECEHFLHDSFKWCPWCGAKVVSE